MPISDPGVTVSGVGAFLPEKRLTNADLEKMVDTSDAWILERTGVKERRIAPPEMATSDMATHAALQALDMAGLDPGELELIIVGTITPDMPFPSTACLVQRNLKASKAAAFDVSAACTGFIYGFATATSMIRAGAYRNALVIGADTLSRITDWNDRATCVLFGDGAGAVVLQRADHRGDGSGVLGFELGADGTGWDLLMLPAGGSSNPASVQTVEDRLHYIKMNGNQVFRFAVKAMGTAAAGCLKRCGLTYADVNLFIPHQANYRIIESAAQRLGIPMEKVAVNIDRYGNMSSASIPVALDECIREGRVSHGDVVLMVAFGSGLTWGAAAFRR